MAQLIKNIEEKVKKLFNKNSKLENETLNGMNRLLDSSESVSCRICNINDKKLLYNPCSCVGHSSFIHRKCLTLWFQRARYDVLCCECKARYIRIRYRNSSFFTWLKEDQRVRRHVIIGSIVFPMLFSLVIFGCFKAAMANTGDIFKVLFVPTMAFGALTLWKFIGSLALILRGYKQWKTSRINTKCDYKHKNDKKE
jgi:hypothetical protein